MDSGATEVSTVVVDADSVVIKTEDIPTNSEAIPIAKSVSWFQCYRIGVIHPDSSLYGHWQVILLVAITVGCILTVYQALVFSEFLSLWVIVYCIDALNLADAVLTVNVGYVDMKGTLVTDRILIWKRYLRTTFFINVASLLPIELFSLLFAVRIMILARLRMNRLIGLVKAYSFIDDHIIALDTNGAVWQLILCVFMAIFTLHISAGVWFAVACTGYHEGVDFYCTNGTWAYATEVIKTKSEAVQMVIATASPFENYLVSLYFVVVTTTTTGYGDITAGTLLEELLAILVMLLGVAVFFGLVLGVMSSLVTNLLKQKSSFLHKISTIQFHLKFRNISAPVQAQVIGYYEYLYLKKNADTSNTFLDILPYVMKVEFNYSTNLVILNKAKIFSDVDVGFLRMLSLKMKQVVYLPNQIVAARGESGTEMFYVHHGELEILSEDDDDTPIAILKEGKLFGEVNLYYSMPRVATVRARTHCDLVLLYKKDLDELLVHYPEVGQKIAEDVKERCRIADEKAGIPDELGSIDGLKFEAKRSRHSGFVPTRGFDPGRQVVLRMSNKVHDRVFRMKRRGEKSITFSSSVEIIPVTLDEEPPSWRETPLLMIQMLFNDFILYVKATTFDPESSKYIMWDDTMTAVILFLSIVYPYMAFFSSEYDSAYLTTEPGRIILKLTYCMELLLFLDIFVTLRTAIVTPNGKLTKFKFIVEHYVKSWVFACDILSSLPIEVLSLLGTTDFEQHYAFGVLKLNRLLKFYRVSRALTWRETSLKYSGYAVRFTKLILYTLMTGHWAACWLYASSCTSTRCSDGWILEWAQDRGIRVEDLAFRRYIISIYFAIVSLTNTGFGDRCPRNTKERVFAIVTMIVGFLVFGYGLSLLSATITHTDSFRTTFQERLFAVSNFMKEHDLQKALHRRVIQYFTILWDVYRGEWFPGEQSLLHEMPINLQLKINMEDVGPVLKELPLFRHIDDTFIKELAHRLVPYIFSPGEFIMYAKEPAKEMYIILKGHCERLSADHKRVLSELGPGDYFGATSMLFKEYKTTSVRTKSCCEVYELKMSTLLEVLEDFPIIEKQFNRVISSRSGLESRVHDVPTEPHSDAAEHEETFGSEISKSVRLRNLLGIASYKKTKIFSDTEDSPFKHWKKFSWLLSHLLMRHTFLPNGNLLMVWTVMMTIVGVAVSALTPIHIAFEHTSPPMWIFLYVLDGIAFIHVYMIGPNTGYYNEENVLVLHPLATASHYVQTNFLLDLLGFLPYEVVLIPIYRELSWKVMHFMAFLRLNRMLQFYRVILAFDYLEMDVYRKTLSLRKVKYLIYLCLFISWTASLLFFVACQPALWFSMTDVTEVSDKHMCSTNSWIFSRKNISFTNNSMFHLYTISIYLSSMTFSSVGYGDFSAKIEHETVVLSIVILAGQLFFTYILASITACVASADAQLARFKERMLHVKSYMETEMIDEELQNRVIAYYEHLWLRTKGVQPHTLFSVLPLSLWSDVTLSLYEDVISSISLFRDTERSFIKTISRCIKPVLFLKGEFIVKKFDIGREMYFIHRGAVDVVSEDGKTVFDTMNAGQAFGEVALLFSVPRTASIRAQANSYLFMLEKEDLDMVLEFYPAIKQHIIGIAEIRQQQARKRSGGALLSDERAADEDVGVKGRRKASGPTKEPEKKNVGDEDDNEDDEDIWLQLSEDTTLGDVDSGELSSKMPRASYWGNEIVTSEELKKEALVLGKKTSGPQTIPPDLVQVIEAQSKSTTDENTDNVSKNNPDSLEADELDEMEFAMKRLNTCVEIISPQNAILIYVKQFICFLSLASCILISYQAAFQDLSTEIFAISYCIEFCFVIEIFLNFHLAYYDTYGDLIDDPIQIRRHYLYNFVGFPLDLVSAFPFELLALAAPHNLRLSVLTYIRIIHLIRLYGINRTLSKLSEDLSSSLLVMKIISNLVSFAFTLHFAACLWFMVACSSQMPCQNIYMDRLIRLTSIRKDMHYSPVTAYLVSIYWSVATATSTGYGDILPERLFEFWYTIAVLIVTRLQIGFIIGDLTSALSSVGARRAEYKENFELFKKVLADRGAPPELERQMVRYYNHLWLYNKGVDVQALLKDLPICMRAEIMEKVAEDFWKAVPFFVDTGKSFLRLISLYVGELVFTKGDCIVRRGDLASTMCFIKHGEVEDVTDESHSETLGVGQIFGVAGTLSMSTYRATVYARTSVVILTLTHADLCRVLRNYPTVEQKTRDYAKKVYDIDFDVEDTV